MNRSLKFRAWDKHNKVMAMKKDIVPAIIFDRENNPTVFELRADMFELMQFTGLKDKNGTDIYEGDIIEWYGSKYQPVIRRIVVWNQGKCRYVTSNSKNKVNTCQQLQAGKIYRLNMNVIGNIYENPELLEKKL